MWTIKPIEGGKTAVIFDEGIFPHVANTDEGCIVTAKFNKAVGEDVTNIESLDAREQAEAITSLIKDRIEEAHGKFTPVRFRSFFNTLELKTGVPISRIHEHRIQSNDAQRRRNFPYRKIDTILSLIPAEEVYKMAKSHEF